MDCIFCKIIEGSIPSTKVYEDDLIIGILDINPVVPGHTLLIPKKHYTDFLELDEEFLKHFNNVTKDLSKKLMVDYQVNAITNSYNYGDSQDVKHFHLHMMPGFNVKK